MTDAARSGAGRRVLVTGHTGFKGAWLALWLHELGAEVTGLLRPAADGAVAVRRWRAWRELATDVRGDVRDAEAVRAAVRAGAAGGRVPPRRAVDRARVARATPSAPTRRTCSAPRTCSSAAGRRGAVVCVTSDKCYAPGDRPHREDDPLGGHDPYSASKAAQELVAAAHRESLGGRVAHRPRRQRDRRRRLGARPAAAGPRPRARVRRAGRRCATPTPSARGSTCSSRSPATCCSPSAWPGRPTSRPRGTSARRRATRGPCAGSSTACASAGRSTCGSSRQATTVEAPALRLDASAAREGSDGRRRTTSPPGSTPRSRGTTRCAPVPTRAPSR